MTEKAGNSNIRRLILLAWILLAFFYGSLTYDYIAAGNKDKELEAYLHYVVQVCGDDHRPSKEVRALVLVKADELKLPLHGEQVSITGNGPTLKVAVSYSVDFVLPVIKRRIYQKVYPHEAAYHQQGQ